MNINEIVDTWSRQLQHSPCTNRPMLIVNVRRRIAQQQQQREKNWCRWYDDCAVRGTVPGGVGDCLPAQCPWPLLLSVVTQSLYWLTIDAVRMTFICPLQGGHYHQLAAYLFHPDTRSRRTPVSRTHCTIVALSPALKTSFVCSVPAFSSFHVAIYIDKS